MKTKRRLLKLKILLKNQPKRKKERETTKKELTQKTQAIK